ncbi:MAG: bifunctional riboflavin kinase/FAD synthetase [Dethiobacter sp.]|jgi:riboflavin kinase/FMN adenylyltransferase|nr:bifunctional riboflavin kinase/FAD synthetase [Dethiobacter sp.]MBS3897937.1 bifunctional riboflavin kinase/FAD synthetase [Dethiobacter sp.]MBS3983685.1 bifunctional riboflavin kinase/FAD synthetase [Dethiobacter sp.]MCL4462962.1 bifunctional riboflavin kinase/FAD synthetase [Bacillota bacterium]MCL5993196.1 bifunctional riboflavin kinase/FAD synthetase [Bacillota bacterium]
MELFQGIETFRKNCIEPIVLALGNFDGVHKGHRQILRATTAAASGISAKSACLIFMPHPLAVLTPAKAPALLLSLQDRISSLGNAGIDYVIVHPFCRNFAAIEPETFVREILHEQLGVSGVVVGFDYSFGCRGAGTASDLKEMAMRFDFFVHVMDPITVDGIPVGSTAIRQYLAAGRVEEAAAMLGYPFYLRGTVVHGDGRGRKLGFPTANLLVNCELIRPGNGVYLSQAACGDNVFWALASVGKRPTFCKDETSLEVYLLDQEKNLYGQELIVSFLQKIRDEIAFSSPAALACQIQNDVALARNLIASPQPWSS